MEQSVGYRRGAPDAVWGRLGGGADGMQRCTVFAGEQMVASGAIESVTRAIGMLPYRLDELELKAFDDLTGQPIPLTRTRRTRGRPRLGVEAGAVMLLPRHWEWLAEQPGGASVHIRRLVEQAWREAVRREPWQHAAAALTRFADGLDMPLPGVDAACAALQRRDLAGALKHLAEWPRDVRDYASRLVGLGGLLQP